MIIGHGALIEDFQGLAREGALGHGYLFHGPARTGKYAFALALARFLEQGAFEAEGEGHPPMSDLLVIEPAEGSIGIDRAREARRFLSQRPNVSPRRTVIVRDAEHATDEAQNALLKVAEEPPEGALIMLVTSDPERLLPTLRSRFRAIAFGGVPTKEIAAWLNRTHKVPATEAAALATAAHGAPGLAWAMKFDEAFRARLDLAQSFLAKPAARAALVKDMLEDESFDLADFLDSLMVAAGGRPAREPALWHALFELRRRAAEFNVNPKLQLMALAKSLS